MFTGIIESLAKVKDIIQNGENIDLVMESVLAPELQVDQSLAHNGICLTIVEKDETSYRVTAIKETIDKTTLGSWKIGDEVNLERALQLGDRLDGHIVQGHVDTRAQLINIEDENGSWRFTFEFPVEFAALIIPKGSICLDGVSLTLINPTRNQFSVAIIPYTFQNTVFHQYRIGSFVNLEFDMLGKYFLRSKLLEPEA